MRVTSPNYDGVEGTACEHVWIFTEGSVLLVRGLLLPLAVFAAPPPSEVTPVHLGDDSDDEDESAEDTQSVYRKAEWRHSCEPITLP
jgi:hypothetical protein